MTTELLEPNIISQTTDFLAIDKPAGWAVEPVGSYPVVGEWLVKNQLINPQTLATDERGGVVHRLDVDTSGVLLWAKNPTAASELRRLWQGRAVEKTYLGLCAGALPHQKVVELAIRRDNQKDRQKVTLLNDEAAREAITEFVGHQTIKVGKWQLSLFEAHPITGRTHQIRIHLKSLGCPIIGDKLYADKAARHLAKELKIERQMLHAWRLKLPWQGKLMELEAPLAADIQATCERLQLTTS